MGVRGETSNETPPWLPGMARKPPRPMLTPELVVEAAHRLIHEGGMEALSIRTLAKELGVGTSAIYRNFAKKEYLLLAVVDFILHDVKIPTSPPAPSRWGEDLRTLSQAVRAVLLAHPNIHPVLVSYITVTPAMLRIAEAAVGILRTAGFDDDDLVHAYNAWSGFVFGFTVLEMKPATPADERDELARHTRAYLEGLDPDRYPQLNELKPQLANRAYALRWEVAPLGRDGDSFDWGLDALIRALEAQRPGKRRRG